MVNTENMTIFDDIEALILANCPGHKDVPAAFASVGCSPSISIAVLEGGVITSRCYSTVGNDTETLFQAASISKPVNALAVMKLIEQGRFTLDSTVRALLPKVLLDILVEGSPPSQRPIVEGITVKQLLSHTAGLTVHGFAGYSHTDRVPSAKEILAGAHPSNSPRIRVAALPGHSHSYSGGGITLLQWILEAVTGQDYPTLMRELVLEPLGMTRSTFGALPEGERNVASAYYTQHTKADVDHHVQPEKAAAGLWTTPTDLLKAAMGVQKSLQGAEGSLLKKETAELMLTKVAGDMALSWVRPDASTFHHNGSNEPGFMSQLYAYAKMDGSEEKVPENCGFAIMLNGGTEPVFTAGWKVALAIAALKKWPLTTSASYLAAIQPFRPIDDGAMGEGWKAWKGEWAAKEQGQRYTLGESEKGKPVLFYGGVGPIALLRTAEDSRFELEGLEMNVVLEEKEGVKTISVKSGLSGDAIELKTVEA